MTAKRDRLARDVIAAAMIEQLAANHGARVVSAAGEGTDGSDDPPSLLMRRMVDAFAEYERAIIRARTKAALGAKRARGESAGNAPFGRSVDAGGRLTVNAAERATIARIHELRAAGTSLRGIVATLATDGRIGRTGKPLQLKQVARIARATTVTA